MQKVKNVTTTNFFKEKNIVSSSFLLICDAPDFWQLSLQDPASSIMEGILLFNKHLLFIIVMIVVLTSWLLFNTIYSYDEFKSSKPSKFFHSNVDFFCGVTTLTNVISIDVQCTYNLDSYLDLVLGTFFVCSQIAFC